MVEHGKELLNAERSRWTMSCPFAKNTQVLSAHFYEDVGRKGMEYMIRVGKEKGYSYISFKGP